MIQNTPTCYQIIQTLKYLALLAKLIVYLVTNDAGSFSFFIPQLKNNILVS